MPITFSAYKRELSVGAAYLLLLGAVAATAPEFFRTSNLSDLALANISVLVTAIGMTLVILLGHIDISVGAQFAVCSVASGLLAKAGLPMPLLALAVPLAGALLGAVNGVFVAGLKIPSIVATLAALVALRDGLRWATEGAWIQELPQGFQWLGLGQTAGQWWLAGFALLIFVLFAWALENLAAGRAILAVGSDSEAARLAGLRPRHVLFTVFVLCGALTGAAAFLNSVRFIEVPSNSGVGLEMKAIAAVVVGGTSIRGGRGSLFGTLVGVALLGTIGTALTFVGINAFWEKAVQGGIILVAVVADFVMSRRLQR